MPVWHSRWNQLIQERKLRLYCSRSFYLRIFFRFGRWSLSSRSPSRVEKHFTHKSPFLLVLFLPPTRGGTKRRWLVSQFCFPHSVSHSLHLASRTSEADWTETDTKSTPPSPLLPERGGGASFGFTSFPFFFPLLLRRFAPPKREGGGEGGGPLVLS